MADSFDDLCGTPSPRRNWFRTGWDDEEARYGSGLSAFQESLSAVFPALDEFPYGLEVSEKSEKKEEKIAGAQSVTVESSIVCPPMGGSDKMPEPTKPEMKMPVQEPDPFDAYSSQPSPAQLQPAETPQEPPVLQTAAPVEDPFFEELSRQAKESKVAKPVETVPAAASPKGGTELPIREPKREEPKSAAAGQVKTAQPQAPKEPALFDDFDEALFKKVKGIVDKIMSGLPTVDMPRILASLPNYAVRLEFDHYRENPDIVGEKLVQVQAMRDSLFALTSQLTAVYYSAKSAADYLSQAALVCSSASSREKRLAQIKLADSEFWVKYAEICRTYESVQQTFDFMNQQYEAISRMITILQIRLRVDDISRGTVPFDSGQYSAKPLPPNRPISPSPQSLPPIPAPVTGWDEDVKEARKMDGPQDHGGPVAKAELSSEPFVVPQNKNSPPRTASGGVVEW